MSLGGTQLGRQFLYAVNAERLPYALNNVNRYFLLFNFLNTVGLRTGAVGLE